MPEAPSGSSFEADLRAIREDRGLSANDIERATRVPADVVRRFEEGALMRDPEFSAVYLRAFVKAYAEALDLSAARTNAAFDAARAGNYSGELRAELEADVEPAVTPTAKPVPKETPSLTKQAPPPKQPAAKKPSGKTQPKATPPPEKASRTPAPPTSKTTAGAAPAVQALAQDLPKERTSPAPGAAQRRAGPPPRVNAPERSWGLIIGIAALSVAALAVVFFLIFRQPGPALEPVAQPTAADTTAADTTTIASAQPAIPPAPQLGDTIRVTIIAADGPLQNFRVEAEPDVRRPYWLEQGNEQTFASPTRVTVWGNETAGGWRIDPEARLRLAGLTWAPPEGRVVRLDRARAQALVDSLHRVQYES